MLYLSISSLFQETPLTRSIPNTNNVHLLQKEKFDLISSCMFYLIHNSIEKLTRWLNCNDCSSVLRKPTQQVLTETPI